MKRKPTDAEMYGRAALKNGWPWIVPDALDFLNEIVSPDWRVFEWGAGGSTVYFARNCQSVISIEHNTEWIDRVNKMLVGLDNVDLRHVRGLPKDVKDRFRPYADAILEFPDESFDLISVDGEASCRGWCVTNALPKLRIGGWLLLDNSNLIKRDFPDFERYDFDAIGLKWIGQKDPFNWYTSILRKVSTVDN